MRIDRQEAVLNVVLIFCLIFFSFSWDFLGIFFIWGFLLLFCFGKGKLIEHDAMNQCREQWRRYFIAERRLFCGREKLHCDVSVSARELAASTSKPVLISALLKRGKRRRSRALSFLPLC